MSHKKLKGRKPTSLYYPAVHTGTSRRMSVPVFGPVGAEADGYYRAPGSGRASQTDSGSYSACVQLGFSVELL